MKQLRSLNIALVTLGDAVTMVSFWGLNSPSKQRNAYLLLLRACGTGCCVVTTVVASEPKRALEAATLVGNPTLAMYDCFSQWHRELDTRTSGPGGMEKDGKGREDQRPES